MQWTYDPIRGVNARLNMEKLGAKAFDFTIDKYGVLESVLYGNVPTDRFTAAWDLDDQRTIDRLHGVWEHSYRSPTLEDVAEIPVATLETARTLSVASAKMVRVEIPGDIDELKRVDPERAVAWQRELREIFPFFLTTKRATGVAPGEVKVDSIKGAYEVNGFVTGLDEQDRRRSYYLLERLNDR
jgi:chorismate synthase